MERLYLIPVGHEPITSGIKHTPKYLRYQVEAGLEDVYFIWEVFRLGKVAVVNADTDDAQHTILISKTDVVAVPPLDNTVTAQALTKVEAVLEFGGIPANWVQVGMTYRTVLRVVFGIMQFHLRFSALIQRTAAQGNFDLTLTVAEIPLNLRNKLQDTADFFSLDTSAVTGTTTVRQLLYIMGQQFAGLEFQLGNIVI